MKSITIMSVYHREKQSIRCWMAFDVILFQLVSPVPPFNDISRFLFEKSLFYSLSTLISHSLDAHPLNLPLFRFCSIFAVHSFTLFNCLHSCNRLLAGSLKDITGDFSPPPL